MIYYKVRLKYEIKEGIDETKLIRFWNKADKTFLGGKTYKLFILNRDETTIDAVLMFSIKDYSLSLIKKRVINEFDEVGETIKSISFSNTPEEISVEQTVSYLHKRSIKGIGGNVYKSSKRMVAKWCDATYMDDDTEMEFDEIVLSHSKCSFSKVKDEARDILADDSLYEELERIYSPLNKRKFCGNPVNYKINAASRETAKRLVSLLTKALYSNKRLLSTRITYITDLGDHLYDDDLKALSENSYASVVVIECDDSNTAEDRFARGHENKSNYIVEALKEYSVQTVFILVDFGSKACKQAIEKLINKEDISFIEISEGKEDNCTGKKYLKSLLKENKVHYAKEYFVLPEQTVYSVNDIVKAYRDIKKNRIRNSIYKAYKEVKTISFDEPKPLSGSYEELQRMIGLSEIKSIIDQIISSQKMNKLRVEMGLSVSGISKHMIFTGNPGSAKTTVARLLASILYEEKVLRRNTFIECGRQDLVGKYVGWTAKQVEEQFRKAIGGILFIDEAYSLVEEGGYYGDEAINTIVQMMENYRDDVIVIFAGYPDKMERFLEKNEGLRSRIAFHVNFPDYNADELCEILKLMSKNKGFTLDSDAEEKCHKIFEVASHNAEFGNGRFVRNVLEQAIVKQSSRLVSEYRNAKADKQMMSVLSASDFDINAAEIYKPVKTTIGFI